MDSANSQSVGVYKVAVDTQWTALTVLGYTRWQWTHSGQSECWGIQGGSGHTVDSDKVRVLGYTRWQQTNAYCQHPAFSFTH